MQLESGRPACTAIATAELICFNLEALSSLCCLLCIVVSSSCLCENAKGLKWFLTDVRFYCWSLQWRGVLIDWGYLVDIRWGFAPPGASFFVCCNYFLILLSTTLNEQFSELILDWVKGMIAKRFKFVILCLLLLLWYYVIVCCRCWKLLGVCSSVFLKACRNSEWIMFINLQLFTL